MRTTSIAIDDGLIRQAQRALGTRGIKDTVDRALQEAVRRAAAERLIERLWTMEGLDLDNSVVMNSAWRE